MLVYRGGCTKSTRVRRHVHPRRAARGELPGVPHTHGGGARGKPAHHPMRRHTVGGAAKGHPRHPRHPHPRRTRRRGASPPIGHVRWLVAMLGGAGVGGVAGYRLRRRPGEAVDGGSGVSRHPWRRGRDGGGLPPRIRGACGLACSLPFASLACYRWTASGDGERRRRAETASGGASGGGESASGASDE